jgi:hypothetical protein
MLICYAFSFRRKFPDMILGDEFLIFKVVLSQVLLIMVLTLLFLIQTLQLVVSKYELRQN